jgi:hypothetical protein
MSSQRNGRNFRPGDNTNTRFCWRLSRAQGQGASERIMSIKNHNESTRNRTHGIPACSKTPQTPVPQRTTL